jgi:hypothetical protein
MVDERKVFVATRSSMTRVQLILRVASSDEPEGRATL